MLADDADKSSVAGVLFDATSDPKDSYLISWAVDDASKLLFGNMDIDFTNVNGDTYTMNFKNIPVGMKPYLDLTKVDGSLIINYHGTIQQSTDLKNWTTVDPQPQSPFEIYLQSGEKVFYKLEMPDITTP